MLDNFTWYYIERLVLSAKPRNGCDESRNRFFVGVHARSLANGRQQKNDRAPSQGAVSRLGSGPAGAHKMHERTRVKCRANERRAELAPAMPSAADIQCSSAALILSPPLLAHSRSISTPGRKKTADFTTKVNQPIRP
jgi:hypothetical protein